MTVSVDIDPRGVYRTFVSAGNDWADKQGAADLREVAYKGVRANLFMEAKSRGLTVAEAEAASIADDKYSESIIEWVEAKREANRARVKYDAVKALFEAQRTAEASHRAAMRSAT
jgi:hypothetical protein